MNLSKTHIIHFFEKPLVQGILFFLIILSTSSVIIELVYPSVFNQYTIWFHLIEYSCLVIFTMEYVLRLWSAPNRKRFFVQPFNLIDLLAILPSYVELIISASPLASTLRTVRLLRLLRLSRILRAFKLFRYGNFFSSVFRYQDTILQSITPVLLGFGVMKIGIVLLERQQWWFSNTNLEELFAIIGFALGIILSQKIGTTYAKFSQVEETTIQLAGTLRTLALLQPSSQYQLWAKSFIDMLTAPSPVHQANLHLASKAIWKVIRELEAQPSEMTILYKDFFSSSQLCLSKAQRLTPIAYDSLLHQATIVYLLLITAFIPGVTGLISTLIATYILYGMYRVTQDLDTIVGSSYKLINIDLTELRLVADHQQLYDNK